MTLTPLSIGHGAVLTRLLFSTVFVSVVAACSPTSSDSEVGAAGDEFAAGLVIDNALVTDARWNSSSATLSVTGKVASGTLVTLKNQNTKEVLAQTASVNGAWQISLAGANMASVPCKVQATTPAVYEIVSVSNTPSNCDKLINSVPNAAPNGTISTPSATVDIPIGGSVSFTSTATDPDGNTPLAYAWDFAGGAASSTVQNPGLVTFARAGSYVVTLIVRDSLGLADPTPAQRVVNVTGPSTNPPPDSVILSPAANVTITAGQTVDFRGSGSDPNNNIPLSFSWNFGGGAANSTAQNPGLVRFNTAGTYLVSLVTRDTLGALDPSPATRTVTVRASGNANTAPNGVITAPAGNVAIAVGGSVNFAATGSDPENNIPLRFSWNFAGAAPSSTSQNPGLVRFSRAGTYVVTLRTTDSLGLADTSPAQVTVTVGAALPNQAPNGTISTPNQNVTIAPGGRVSFTSTGVDPDGNTPLTYAWNFGTAAPASTAQNPGNITFANAGTYVVSLTVRDALGLVDATPAQVTVTVTSSTVNRAPDSVMVAPSTDSTVNVGTAVLFSGLGIDPDGDTRLAYSWDFGGGAVNSALQSPGAVAFNRAGTFQIRLTVSDSLGLADATPATRAITVRPFGTSNSPPQGTITSPAADQTIAVGDSVVFFSVGQDQDNNVPLSYQWNFDGAAPNMSAQNPGVVRFTKGGIYTVAMTVTDALGLADPTPDIRTIHVGHIGVNDPPVGTITSPVGNQTINVGQSISFSGNAVDVNGNSPFSYEWNFDGATANSTARSPGNIRFDRAGVYYVALTVRDNLGLKDPTPDVRVITVDNPNAVNQAPSGAIVSPVTNITVNMGDIINFRGVASDPEGDTALTYAWNFGPSGVSTALAPGDVTFSTPGVHRIAFVVTDSRGLQDPTPAVRLVTVLPVVTSTLAPDAVISSPVADLQVTAGSSVSFNGYGSDPDNNTPLKYLWDFDGAAPNTVVQTPGSIVFNKAGTYRVRLNVTDSTGLSDPTPGVRIVTVVDPNTTLGNVAPSGMITSPMTDTFVTVGDTLLFTGIGVDPDSNRALTYRWNFDGAAPNSAQQTPGNVTFDRVGTYVVWMTVTDADGMSDLTPDIRVIVVRSKASSNVPPNASITSPTANATVLVGSSLYFNASGSDPDGNNPLRFIWNLAGVAPNVVGATPGDLTFTKAGTYKIAVTVVDALGLADPTPAERTITVTDNGANANLPPRGQIQSPFQDVTINVGDNVYFSAIGEDPDANIPLTFTWDFGGGATNVTSQVPGSIAFNRAGTFRVTMNVRDAKGLADPLTDVRVVTVLANNAPGNSAPVGTILEPATDITVDTTTPLHFIAYGTDPDVDIPLTFIWDFGGGAPNMEGQYAHNIIFPRAGTYVVRLLVADSRGLADPTPVTRTITVRQAVNSNVPPNGTIVTPASVVNINVGQSASFSSSGTDPNGNTPLSYQWNFGGGAANMAVQNPGSVSFSAVGTYYVTLTVTDSLGLADPSPAQVVVNVVDQNTNLAPIGIITSPASDMTVSAGTTLTFSGNAVDPDNNIPISYSWNLAGVAPNSVAQNPGSIRFGRTGTYRITLTVTDSKGLKDATPEMRTITVR